MGDYMKDLSIKNILGVTNGKLLVGKEDYIVKSYSKDTRTIKNGDCYIGIKGENFDGNLFWEKALGNGASTVIVQNVDIDSGKLKKWEDKNIIKVEDTLEALYGLARYKRNLYDIPVIAITGSVGKTSTKDIVANVVAKKYKTLKTEGNNNNNIGLPFTILRMQDEEAAVLEMGMNHFGEISLLNSIANPNICIITNIGTSHIGNLGSRENILKAKLEILEGSKKRAVIINNDNDLLHKWYEENKKNYNIKTYGLIEKSDIMPKDIVLGEQNSKFSCDISGNEERITVPVGGEHFILNSLCAITVGEILGIEQDKIKEGIEKFELTKKRMDIIELQNGIKIISDAYNASLESIRASLKVLAEFKENRKIAVLGDMFELGDYAKELHEKVGKEVVKNNIDILIACGENSKYMAEEARNSMGEDRVYYLENKENIESLLQKIVKSGDVILFKASNGMRFYKIAERMVELWKRKN